MLGRLGQRYPDTLLELVKGKESLNFFVIQGMGWTGDARLKTLAQEALRRQGEGTRSGRLETMW
jgi:hypothetical protein